MIKRFINKPSTFIKYLISGGLCFFIDILLFTIFNFIFTKSTYHIIYATILARIISSVVNYSINRNQVFMRNNQKKIDKLTLTKYFLLVIIQMFISAYTVDYLFQILNVNESLIKIIVDATLCLINYFIQKRFIFNTYHPHQKTTLILLAIITSVAILYHPLDTQDIIKISYQNKVLLSSLLAIVFYLYYRKYNKLERKKSFTVLSSIFTIFLIIGYSIKESSSLKLIFDDIQYLLITFIKYIGYYTLINLTTNVIYQYLEKIKISDYKEIKVFRLFKKNPFLFSIITLSIIYGIYLIIYYPGIVGYDPSYQIQEVLGIPNFYTESAGSLVTTTITAYNPVFHTLLIGYLFKIGLLFNNANLGIFIYTFIQMSFMVFTLSYSIKFLHQEKVADIILLVILGIYVFVPIFPFYGLSSFKDTYFALFMVLYIIELCRLLKYQYQKKDIIRLIIIATGLFLFRHNGILTIILSLPFFIIPKKNHKQVFISLIGIMMLFFTYNGLIAVFEITPSSRREVLSVPLQQTARLVSEKEEILEENDKKIINKIIDYYAIKEKYNKELSDPIKNTFKNEASNDDLKEYFKVWGKYFIKEPRIYLEATLNNMYGYIYPNAQNWYFYHMKYNVLNETGYDYHYNNLDILRSITYGYGELFAYIPVLNLFVNIGIMTWIYLYLVGYLIESKNKKYILLLLPAFSIILACVLGPVNTYYRYVIPYSFTLPIILAFILKNKRSVNN